MHFLIMFQSSQHENQSLDQDLCVSQPQIATEYQYFALY
jgi:hypothetical protein